MLSALGYLAVPCILCFLFGILMFIVEMFTPGFGVAGGLGIASFAAIIVMQFLANSIMLDLLNDIKFKVAEKFREIQEIEITNEFDIHLETFNKDESLKWEKGVKWSFDLGGAVIGTAIGAASKTAILAALGGSGPAGWIAAGVGLAIYGLFNFVGRKIKKIKQAKRAAETKREIAPHIDDFESSLAMAVQDKFNDFMTSCNNLLGNILKDRIDAERRLKESFSRIVDSSEESQLKEDFNYLSVKQKEFENV